MTLFKTLSSNAPAFETERLLVRAPEDCDFGQWSELRADSRAFLQPFEPLWPDDELSRAAYRRRLRRYQQDAKDRAGYAFFLFRHGDERLLGGMTLSNIRYGVTQSAALGYWMGAGHIKKGYMREAVRGLFPFVYRALALNRLEAACLPQNAASISLLKALNFEKEGLARSYLKINGRWQDHLLFARLASDGDRT